MPLTPIANPCVVQAWTDARKGTTVYRPVVVEGASLSTVFPGLAEKVDFDVAWEAVSLHLPLHRFFCKVCTMHVRLWGGGSTKRRQGGW